ncbi:hypothetical protein J2741_002225 [Methanolinea mesophila]|uniref:type IV pilin n=1 Tax=Methanolinea mesophila TaxID=547055 RepID=UPI001AE10A4D|nr:type IV pilin [Methanolinea mesophila]MBP1929678.1 hypothetical protein [Methanolinea mesophila]
MQNTSAVSELVGTLILIAIISGAVGIVAVAILSQPVPRDIPAVRVFVIDEGYNLTLQNQGGDTLPPGTYRILVNSADRTADFTPPPSVTPFMIGQTLTLTPVTGVRSVTLVYQGEDISEGVVLFSKNFE